MEILARVGLAITTPLIRLPCRSHCYTGYAHAAVHLSRNWVKDPESLPFVGRVEPHTLIRLLQDGLLLDKLKTEATGASRLYDFGTDHGRKFSAPDVSAVFERDSRRRAEALNGVIEEPKSYAPLKRKRKSLEERTDGGMDIDKNATHTPRRDGDTAGSDLEDADGEYVNDVALPLTPPVPTPTTLSVGHTLDVETEKPVNLNPGTKFLKVTPPNGATVLQTTWNPFDSQMLCVSGDSLLRFYAVPESDELDGSMMSTPHHDIDLHLENFSVSAFCWDSSMEATVGVSERFPHVEGTEATTSRLIRLRDWGNNPQVLHSGLGTIFILRWNATNETLLCVAGSDERSTISLWPKDSETSSAQVILDHAITDAAWTSKSEFVTSGDRLARAYAVSSDGSLASSTDLATDLNLAFITADPSTSTVAAASADGRIIIAKKPKTELQPDERDITMTNGTDRPPLKLFELNTSPRVDSLVALQLQRTGGSIPGVLAGASGDGIIKIIGPDRFESNDSPTLARELALDEAPAYAMAFSEKSPLFAAAGLDTVTVWDTESGCSRKAVWKWRQSDEWNTELDETQTSELLHQLSWDAEGKRLAFTLGNQIALITYQR